MSQEEELLNSLTPYAVNDPEERFVVGSDRFITVPRSMRRIGEPYFEGLRDVKAKAILGVTGSAIEIPEAVRQLDGYGEEGSYVDLRNRRFVKEDSTIVDISHLLSPDNLVAVTPGGTLSIVTETGEAVPSEISWSSC